MVAELLVWPCPAVRGWEGDDNIGANWVIAYWMTLWGAELVGTAHIRNVDGVSGLELTRLCVCEFPFVALDNLTADDDCCSALYRVDSEFFELVLGHFLPEPGTTRSWRMSNNQQGVTMTPHWSRDPVCRLRQSVYGSIAVAIESCIRLCELVQYHWHQLLLRHQTGVTPHAGPPRSQRGVFSCTVLILMTFV